MRARHSSLPRNHTFRDRFVGTPTKLVK